jgi:hypothetical protein
VSLLSAWQRTTPGSHGLGLGISGVNSATADTFTGRPHYDRYSIVVASTKMTALILPSFANFMALTVKLDE